jgi:hypothetical protein
MRDVLDSVTSLPGVRVAAVFSDDGLPLCVLEAGQGTGEWHDRTLGPGAAVESQRIDSASIVAFAASWVDDLCRTSGGAGWDFERRFTLVATEGTLVVQLGPTANVLAVLEPGIGPDTVAFPMEVSVERLQRLLRGMGRSGDEQLPAPIASSRTENDAAADAAATTPVGGTVPVHQLMDHPVSDPGAAADVPATGSANEAPQGSSGDH